VYFHKHNLQGVKSRSCDCEIPFILILDLNIFFTKMYSKNVLDVDCQTQGRLKLVIALYVSEKSVINSKYTSSSERLRDFKLY
jgi:hypothetical protein